MDGVTFEGAQLLLRLFEEISQPQTDHIKDRYSEQAGGFEEVLEFLEASRIIKTQHGQIHRGQQFVPARDKLKNNPVSYNKFLVELALRLRTRHGEEIRNLLSQFEARKGPPRMATLPSGDIRYVVRNALIEAGIIELDHETGNCEVPVQHHALYNFAKHTRGTSPEELAKQNTRKLEVGFQAELSVLNYEKGIVGHEFADQVVHVAHYNTAAGFDIASIRVTEGRTSEERIIEVKAVSPKDQAFFLTVKEHETAKFYRERYYLYLVPIRNQRPNIQGLTVIRDPVETVINNFADWLVTHNTLHCKKNDNAPKK